MVQLAEADLAFQDRSFWYSRALHLASNRTISDDRVIWTVMTSMPARGWN